VHECCCLDQVRGPVHGDDFGACNSYVQLTKFSISTFNCAPPVLGRYKVDMQGPCRIFQRRRKIVSDISEPSARCSSTACIENINGGVGIARQFAPRFGQ